MGEDQPDVSGQPPTALRLFLVFSRIGLTSFGGGLSGWLMREFVEGRRWLTEEEFLNGLSLSQALPGVNVTNMAIWIGFRLRGTAGALASIFGIIVPPAIVIIFLSVLFGWAGDRPFVHTLLDGAAAAAVGLSLSMGLRTAWRVPRRAFPLAVLAISFAAIAFAHISLIWVVFGLGAVSVAAEYIRLGA